MLKELSKIADRFGLNEIYAFGSRAAEMASRVRGERGGAAGLESDVDIGVRPEAGRRFSVREKVELAIALEDLFHVPRVDLVMITEAAPFLALDIIRGDLLYCRNQDEQAEFELYVLRRAGDLAYYEREKRRLILSGERRI
jgi:predicted nucleotidyltransferase